MILIISEEEDISTNIVIDWLHFYGQNFIRVNKEDKIFIKKFHIHNNSIKFEFIHKNQFYDSDSILSVWNRRGTLFPKRYIEMSDISSLDLRNALVEPLSRDYISLVNYLHYFFERKEIIGKMYNRNINKLMCLHIAKDCGMEIPETLVSNEKQEIINFAQKHFKKGIITKGIQETIFFDLNNTTTYAAKTESVDAEDLKELPDEFFPLLIQDKIPKKYELRIFFLNDELYTMAIFSQFDEQTSTDFRNYNYKKPNRTIPYILPPEIRNKLIQFMHQVDLNTGSIDMILTPDNRYIFLEVNPVGQFGMVSYPCNYGIEKKIAEILIQCNSF
ncbi:MAG: grasp-with-spasm system ATP-grasp peptide maturase [Microscillaceae bacterium]|nr:grasp-with-spasm system ATP-grasp peptide maturase [Microscillaceae bacterium]